MAVSKSEHNIETDAFDRELFSKLESASEELRDIIDKGSTLLPSFHALTSDLFASFYKHNVLFIDDEQIRRGSRLTRRILEKVFKDPHYNGLREDTVLDGFKSALAVIEISTRVYEWLRSDEGPGEKALLNEHKAEQAEQEVEDLKEEMETWNETEEKLGETSEEFDEAKKDREGELSDEEAELTKLTEEQEKSHEKSDLKLANMVRSSMRQTEEKIDEAEDELMSWGANMGAPGERGVGEKLDLAAKLYKNEKLRKLSRIVGGLKEEMLSARKKTWAKRGSEVFDIASGDDIGRIIPSELLALSHPLLRHDFHKRFVEGRLLQYYLKEEKGRGPMVICLDGSSSMEGPKELWSKGVCLTLLEIAKRERRKFNVVVFSSGGQPLKVFESIGREGGSGWGMKEKDVFELAEYFPGGGTNFEEPLNKALELLQDSKFKGGDIVFITDGESNVGDAWLKSFEEEKQRLKFKVYSVLIDLSERESWQTLNHFSDKVTSISQLTSSEARGLFLDI